MLGEEEALLIGFNTGNQGNGTYKYVCGCLLESFYHGEAD